MMKKRIIYFLFAVIGTVGFNSCGPSQGTNETNQDTMGTGTETTTGTNENTSGTTTGDRTGTTGDVNRTSGSTDNYGTGTMQDRNNFELTDATDYTYGTDNYRFTPDSRGITITRNQDGQESPYGTMRSFGDDGYYIITTTSTTTGEEEVAVGRFDELGNFTIYRYDRHTDDISEENYRSGNSQNTNQNQEGIIDPMNDDN